MILLSTIFILLIVNQYNVDALNCYICANANGNAEVCPYPFTTQSPNVLWHPCGAGYTDCSVLVRVYFGQQQTFRICSKGEYPNGLNYISTYVYFEGPLLVTYHLNSYFNVSNCQSDYCNNYDIKAPPINSPVFESSTKSVTSSTSSTTTSSIISKLQSSTVPSGLSCFECSDSGLAAACPYPFTPNGQNVVYRYCGTGYTQCTVAVRMNEGVQQNFRFCSKGEYSDGLNFISTYSYYYDGSLQTMDLNTNFNISNCQSNYCNMYDIKPPT